ncbi:hypothetical protein D2T31_05015 [Sinirhodobacter populi]|uniref:Uncharacterized protein n=1 Tax=Paenirhodobacter populi TaxID=2306993 RepID=A0A443KFA6_9RHOB|nr:hypothetical protein [Sinirhodobacter populi]RWR31362.1 hypothetical protein D2T31_05015 [Sinirhodobacter populi]
MAVRTTAVAGAVARPDGSAALDGDKIVFTRRQAGASGGTMVMHGPVATIVSAGAISAVLSRDDDGRAVYDVSYHYWSSASRGWVSASIGPIVIDGPGVYSLAKLLPLRPTATMRRLICKRGATLTIPLQIAATVAPGVLMPQDLTGQAITAELRGPDGVDRPLGVVISATPVDGKITLSMTPSQTAALPLGAHRWDVRRAKTTGQVQISPTGTVAIIEEITNG